MGRPSRYTPEQIATIMEAKARYGSAEAAQKLSAIVPSAAAVRGIWNRWHVRAQTVPVHEHKVKVPSDSPKSNGNGHKGNYASLAQPYNVRMRAAVFDIETTDFGTDGYEGSLVCCSVLPLDADRPHTYKLAFKDRDDRRLLAETMAGLAEFDILIGHYILGFDLPWLSSRLMYHRMPPMRRWFIADTCTWARALKLTTSKKLGSLIDYFRIPGAEKTAVQRTTWSHVRSKFEDEFNMAISDIVYHCETDVVSNRGVFNHLYPRVMSARYSSSSPLVLNNQGMSVPHWYVEAA